MRSFVPALRRISGELRVPERVKARILLEMVGDLEELYEHFRSRGHDEDEAVRLTEERILASPEALQHLILVHTTGYQRWLDRAAERVRWGFDLVLFGFGVMPMVLLSTWLLVAGRGRLVENPGLWPLLLVGAAATGLALWKAIQLVAGRTRSTAELHRGLPVLLFLGVMAPLLGGAVFLVHLYGLLMEAGAGGAGEEVLLRGAESLERGATSLSLGLLVAIGAGLMWFVLAGRISAVELAESAPLLAE